MKSPTVSAILTLLAATIHGQDLILNAQNFATEVDNGTWLIKFFSPTCGYSKKLAPVWEQFTKESLQLLQTKNFHIGEVDCTKYGSLCDENKVDGYPTINLYRKGVFVEEYIGSRSTEALTEYAKNKA
ncbi:protein disulfide isomerase PDI5 [Basidiobolus meristosporus CBS 931.73]|uniref:Protein disulfide isomerase PDI5 n=1 Tax=Basidiobolus meristosporus CBS 931.73 TaxID=1314790 RepID=A0A1Y1XS43_9FUNG|nr:protein disulfide isomerase PDI5 [Basidiobolus meristosporus CBS 931.73]|eukprot:ORX88558.1 protein disulfide isomerase PDI5 [Basidiobolus meristosporus CBS 931.73]